MVLARLSLTASATRCCWAPSWMSRSSRLRARSWAATMRLLDSLICSARIEISSRRACSSTVRRALRNTIPACAARSDSRRRSALVTGSPRSLAMASAPSSSCWWVTAATSSAPAIASIPPPSSTMTSSPPRPSFVSPPPHSTPTAPGSSPARATPRHAPPRSPP